MTGAPLLEVRDLHVGFDLEQGGTLHAVRGVSFSLDAGARLGLVGESGCGKSTTILTLMGLLPPSAVVEGEVLLRGTNILARGEHSVRRYRWTELAMVFQGAMNAFSPVKRIGDQIAEPMEFHKIAEGGEAKKRVGDLLELVGIHRERASRYPHEFSGGMRQRASIAMALACKPSILLADEPTTALDVMVQAQILELLVSLTRDLDLALVLVTHDLPIVAQVCDRVAVMYAGRQVETATTEAVYRAPQHPYTRLLLAATPDPFADEAVASIPGVPPRLDRELTGCPFAARCDRTFEPCTHVKPETLSTGTAHDVECHLYDPAWSKEAKEAV